MRTILINGVLGATLLTGCGSARTHGLQVVASTNVYGDIARQIGGPDVHVTSILSDPNADPHLFEAGTANALAIAHAKVVIENGLGYDAFMDKLESAAPSSSRIDVSIADALGIRGSDANPHLWYDAPALGRIARAISDAFARGDPEHALEYGTREEQFARATGSFRFLVEELRKEHAGTPVASTEPLPDYLLAALGLRELAPPAFTRSIENGTEPTPGALAAMLRLVSERRIHVLLYNTQAVSPITSRIRSAARAAGIPVVGMRETLPAGENFQTWQLAQLRALGKALE